MVMRGWIGASIDKETGIVYITLKKLQLLCWRGVHVLRLHAGGSPGGNLWRSVAHSQHGWGNSSLRDISGLTHVWERGEAEPWVVFWYCETIKCSHTREKGGWWFSACSLCGLVRDEGSVHNEGLECLVAEDSPRELEKALGGSIGMHAWWEMGMKKKEPDSSQQCPVTAMRTSCCTGKGTWTEEKHFLLWGWSNTCAGCPGRLWSL